MFDGIIGYIVGGAVIGILARFIKPGADPMGWIMTIVLGMAGAVLGGWMATQLGVTSRLIVWALAIIAAIALLVLQELFTNRRRSSRH